MRWLTISVLFMFAFISGQAIAALPGPLVDAEWLNKNRTNVLIIDVRKDTNSFKAKPVFAMDRKSKKKILHRVGGHIPGSVLMNYKQIRSKRKIDGKLVEGIIPLRSEFERLMQAHGVNKDSDIVIVSKGMNAGEITGATRLYWQIKYFGHDKVALLDGGMAAWLSKGYKAATAGSKAKKGNWKATTERKELLASSDDVARAMKDNTQLVDNRVISQYLGLNKRSYVYALGHIPGARFYPTELMTGNVPATFNSKDSLTSSLKAMGIDPGKPTIAYCNSGHLASGGWFVQHELLGNKNVKLYDGSMHQWTLEKRPVSAMKME